MRDAIAYRALPVRGEISSVPYQECGPCCLENEAVREVAESNDRRFLKSLSLIYDNLNKICQLVEICFKVE